MKRNTPDADGRLEADERPDAIEKSRATTESRPLVEGLSSKSLGLGKKGGLRLALYRGLIRWGIKPGFLARLSLDPRAVDERERWHRGNWTFAEPSAAVPRAWFHAASVGELESLWTVIEAWVSDGGEALVTILSGSALPALERLKTGFEPAARARLLFAGYSPWEGDWAKALERAHPKVFVTAKYEAWPELWAGLSRQAIPLFIVGAVARRSLKVAKAVLRGLGEKLPKLTLATAFEEDEPALRALFPGSSIETRGEPRWDRVHRRAQTGNSRAGELVSLAVALRERPRPWLALGSAWPADIDFLGRGLPDFKGTLWVVPHRVDLPSLRAIETALERLQVRVERSSEIGRQSSDSQAPRPPHILVDEMGFLSELYRSMDAAYVGGGFGEGVHSTIEPAIQGLPIACGTKRVSRFPEIAFLERQAQLKVLRQPDDAIKWLGSLAGSEATRMATREKYRAGAARMLGGTERVLRAIREAAGLVSK